MKVVCRASNRIFVGLPLCTWFLSLEYCVLTLKLRRQEPRLCKPQCSIHNRRYKDVCHSSNGSWLFETVSYEIAFYNDSQLPYSIVNSLFSVLPKRIEHGLRHLAPIIHARRKEREQKGHEKPVGVVYSSSVLTKF